ncbi:hypothetical protein RV11_GL001435 [Enterococcus phoeniculicola]|nr:hypothetical protein RV11_GL001435 [Enterococcus phoeniculicola]
MFVVIDFITCFFFCQAKKVKKILELDEKNQKLFKLVQLFFLL